MHVVFDRMQGLNHNSTMFFTFAKCLLFIFFFSVDRVGFIQPESFLDSLPEDYETAVRYILEKEYGNFTRDGQSARGANFRGDGKGVARFIRGSWTTLLPKSEIPLKTNYGTIKDVHLCDCFVLSPKKPPALFVFLTKNHKKQLEYCRNTALAIKLAITKYVQLKEPFFIKFMVIPFVRQGIDPRHIPHVYADLAEGNFTLGQTTEPRNTAEKWKAFYPGHYSHMDEEKYYMLAEALTLAMLTIPSGFVNRYGEEFLNLLTREQFDILLDCRDDMHQLIQGPAGSGKTLLAKMLIDKLKNTGVYASQIMYVTVHRASATQMEYVIAVFHCLPNTILCSHTHTCVPKYTNIT